MAVAGSPSRDSIQDSENGAEVKTSPQNRAPSPHPSKSDHSSLPDIERQDRGSFPSLHVLIAEDNFVSQRMLEKRLLQHGYTIVTAGDGQEAHDRFVTSCSANGTKIDVVLMDMKMPLVDGALATKMIRFWEKESHQRQQSDGRDSATPKQRVPIIAIAPSLQDDARFDFIQNGFDGWLVKPLDFKRLDVMLQGVKDVGMRCDSLYVPGQGSGGWFFP